MPGLQDLTGIGTAADAAQTLFGIGQTLFSGRQRAQRNLQNLANSYQPNQSILDYYNKALAKYSANPYTSAAYQNRANITERNLTTGIDAAQNRRAGVGAVGGLVQGANDANAQAAGQAEAEQRANLSQLGAATQAKAAEDYKPFEIKYNLLAAKAAGANATQAAGFKNIYGGLQGASDLSMAQQLYGTGYSNPYGRRTGGYSGWSPNDM